MGISYAGVPLLLESPDGYVADWLDDHSLLADLTAFSSTHIAGMSNLATARLTGNVGLPRPNWTDPPRVRFNTLYWPTGASRWAFGLFLADDLSRNSIVARASGGQSQQLRMDDDVHNPIAAQMHLLPPRPLGAIGVDLNEPGLWIIPLVDVRWYWQFGGADDLTNLDESSAWEADIFSNLATELGVTLLNEAPASGYHQPDYLAWGRRYENAAVLLDAAAFCVGQRIVRDLDGNVWSQGFGSSESVLDANLGNRNDIIAGAEFSLTQDLVTPEEVEVVFPKYFYRAAAYDGERYALTSSSGRPSFFVSGLKKTIHDTMPADFTGGSATADNETELQALADTIADDFYHSTIRAYDITFAGLQAWRPANFDDWIIWTYARRVEAHDDGTGAMFRQAEDSGVPEGWISRARYICQTRVSSVPHNFGVEEMLHGDGLAVILGGTFTGKTKTGGIAAYSGTGDYTSATVDVHSVDNDGTPTDRGFDVEVFNNLGAVDATEHIQSKRVQNIWMVDAEKC